MGVVEVARGEAADSVGRKSLPAVSRGSMRRAVSRLAPHIPGRISSVNPLVVPVPSIALVSRSGPSYSQEAVQSLVRHGAAESGFSTRKASCVLFPFW